MPVQSFSKEQYPGIHDLLAGAELASILSMHRVEQTEGPMNIARALVQTEVDEIEAKLSAMTHEQRSDIVDAMVVDDPQIEALLNNRAEYVGANLMSQLLDDLIWLREFLTPPGDVERPGEEFR